MAAFSFAAMPGHKSRVIRCFDVSAVKRRCVAAIYSMQKATRRLAATIIVNIIRHALWYL